MVISAAAKAAAKAIKIAKAKRALKPRDQRVKKVRIKRKTMKRETYRKPTLASEYSGTANFDGILDVRNKDVKSIIINRPVNRSLGTWNTITFKDGSIMKRRIDLGTLRAEAVERAYKESQRPKTLRFDPWRETTI